MQYVVYVDDPTNHARVHQSTCRWYVNRKPSRLPDNRWLGSFDSVEEAIDIGADAGKRDYDFCGHCIR